ncbi:MAG: tyrosine-type recombinase/integrase [Treponema sp.]|nr:tyrosine-type recombinase/integrase [Treponema sp.]
MRCPFYLQKKKTRKGLVWYARFWNEKEKKYTIARSTGIIAEGKKERRREAELRAKEMLSEIRFETDAADCLFISYLENFWKSDSPYVKECANIKKKPLSGYYIHQNAVNVDLHVKPFPKFKKITLRELTSGIIKDWMSWAVDNELSGGTINSVLSTMRVAVNYAVEREELDRSPFRNVKEAADNPKEKGVLSYAERAKLINAKSTDPYSRLAILLGLLCGMRRGEVRGLKWGDFDNGLISLTHNFVNIDGLKKPKRGKERTVPYLDIVEKALEDVRKVSIRPFPDNYIFESLDCPGKPMGETFFRNALRRELEGIGISAKGEKATKDTPAVPSEQKRRNLSFHSLRHSFITLGRLDGLTDLEIQAIGGHSTRRMMEHYTHAEKVIDFKAMREKMGKVVGM